MEQRKQKWGRFITSYIYVGATCELASSLKGYEDDGQGPYADGYVL
jgi:hypothetical protein